MLHQDRSARCDQCGAEFNPKHRRQRFCSTECATAERDELRAAALANDPTMTYEQIGAELGISHQRVQQLERSALLKLRSGFNEAPPSSR